jgi:hypothetical protein
MQCSSKISVIYLQLKNSKESSGVGSHFVFFSFFFVFPFLC